MDHRSQVRTIAFLAAAMLCCAQWPLLAHHLALSLLGRTILPGVAIFGAALLLSWGSEVLQFDIPRTLAFAFVALVAVLPEYAVDIYFAWMGGKNESYVQYALANMTGANRILIGVGWSGVLLAYAFKSRRRVIELTESHRVEMVGMGMATLYAFLLPLKGNISLIDSIFLLLIFGMYIRTASRAHVVEPELEGGPAELVAKLAPRLRRGVAALFFVIAGVAIYTAAKPFAEGLLEAGSHLGVDRFVMVQWVAPIASESPEFLIASIFALRLKPTAGLCTVISSMINQWTLLVGALPIAYCLSAGHVHAMQMDPRQIEEVFLTAAQSLFALIVVINLRFQWWEALVIFTLFAVQVFFPSTAVRFAFALTYVVLALGLAVPRQTRVSVRRTWKTLIS